MPRWLQKNLDDTRSYCCWRVVYQNGRRGLWSTRSSAEWEAITASVTEDVYVEYQHRPIREVEVRPDRMDTGRNGGSE